jgi:hypothetical protein
VKTTKKKKVAPKSSAKAMAKKPATKKGAQLAKAKKPLAKAKAKAKKPVATKAPSAPASKAPAAGAGKKWLAFVDKHGVVLASAKGPVPSLAQEIAGEPIIGSWWSHPKANEIFELLNEIEDDVDVRAFKLVDGKVTFVHRRMWPALVRLARDGVLTAERVESVHQEHTETGEHRNFNVPFPEWVEEDIAKAADALTTDGARAELGAWV